jgi:hypothetical protein
MTTHHEAHSNAEITIRRVDLAEADIAALSRLAERDSHEQPLAGPVIGIEVEGTLLAAMSIPTGEVIADPFSRTKELRAMLELRTAQIRRRNSPRRYGRRLSRRRGHAAVGGSPAGQILSLPRWG